MNLAQANSKSIRFLISLQQTSHLRVLFAGLLLPFGFAPFHYPGLVILGLALFFASLREQNRRQAFFSGFLLGLTYFGLGVSWIYVSIHTYGHLHPLLSAFATLLFIVYLALFTGLVGLSYKILARSSSSLLSALLFSAVWCLGEYLRANVLTGFPWLMVAYSQMDSPLQYLLPIIGLYGLSFMCCFSASLLALAMHAKSTHRYALILAFMAVFMGPSLLQYKTWAKVDETPLSVAVIQANLSMRNKWDESLFWQLLDFYRQNINQLLDKKDVIVLPESALPIPANYISDVLNRMDEAAKHSHTAILLGIPKASSENAFYYNSMLALGDASGDYIKQHLVPFGEYIPGLFSPLIHWLNVPISNLLKPAQTPQNLIQVHHQSIASLICYEVAYPELLRQQLPQAQWIVAISDDGWFGHSLAAYQQLQMSQALSLQTARYQVVSNNDGLSSMINTEGHVSATLPAFTSGLLEARVYPASGATPWVRYGDTPILGFFLLLIGFGLYRRKIIDKTAN